MSVHEAGRRLKITDGSVTLTAWVDSDGKIAISHALFGLRLTPEDLRTVLDDPTHPIHTNHEADVLCCVPLTLAETVQAVHDALWVAWPEAFDKARQALVHKASTVHARDPFRGRETKGDSQPEQGQVWRTKAPYGPTGQRELTLVVKVDYTPQDEVYVTYTSSAGDFRGERGHFLSMFEHIPRLDA